MMKLDAAARDFEVVESDVLELHQSRISVSIALEGERSQSCEAFVCGGKTGNDLWTAAVVYLALARRALVYRYDGKIGKEKGAFEAAIQEALDYLIPLGFELDQANLKYSQAMRQVVLKGIRGIKLLDGKGTAKKSPALTDQRKTTAKMGEDAAPPEAIPTAPPAAKQPAAPVAKQPVVPVVPPPAPVLVEPATPAYGEVALAPEPEKVAPVTENTTAVEPKVVAAESVCTGNAAEIAALRALLQQAEQEKLAAEAEVTAEKKKYQAEVVALLKVQKSLEAAEAAVSALNKEHAADLARLQQELDAKDQQLGEAMSRQSEADSRSQQGSRKEASLRSEIDGLKAELSALRDETQKALRQVAVAEAATKDALAETENVQHARDALAKVAEKERGEFRAVREQLAAELDQVKKQHQAQVAELQQAIQEAADALATERATGAERLATLHGDMERSQRDDKRAQQELQAALAHAQDEAAQMREQLAGFQEDSGKVIAELEEKRRAFASRYQAAEAEVDRLMQTLVDTEAEAAARCHAQAEGMAERVAVLKGVVEQLWPVDGTHGSGMLDQAELARIAAAPLKVASSPVPVFSAPIAAKVPVNPPKPMVAVPKIPIVPPFLDEIEELVEPDEVPELATPASVEPPVVVVDYEPVPTASAPEIVADTPSSSRFFGEDMMAAAVEPGQASAAAGNYAIDFNEEDWADLDLSGGDDSGTPVQFKQDAARAKWTVALSQLRTLYTSGNVQQIAPPGGGPGTYQAFVCLAARPDGGEECLVLLEQTEGARNRLVYVPEQAAAQDKLVRDGIFFVESIGFMMMEVDLQKDTPKRATVLKKCRSFING